MIKRGFQQNSFHMKFHMTFSKCRQQQPKKSKYRKYFGMNFIMCMNESVLIFFQWEKGLSDLKMLENQFKASETLAVV